MAFLTRIDPTRNIDRFYVVQVFADTLRRLDGASRWGRRGSPGTLRLSTYQRRNAAETAGQRIIKRRLQHGYRGI